jgi:predicted AAA+ superfamily ATPase
MKLCSKQTKKMDTIIRKCKLNNDLEESAFLFGARQTGKSTFLRKNFPKALYFDLLDTELNLRLAKRPGLLYEMLKDEPVEKLVIIDEIPEVPLLLNEVHRLISEKNMRFILCGSSARKLKRKGYNTLGGRALPYYFYPLVSAEIPDFNLQKALTYGMLPPHYLSQNSQQRLSAYIDVYLREEVKAEALVRNLDGFQRFLEIAAITSGEMLNYNNVASDCGISANTAKEYFSILEDTLIGYMVPAYTKVAKRNVIQASRFYFFDVGVCNFLLHRKELQRGTPEYGHAFEHFVMQEIRAYLGYTQSEKQLSYWRTYTGIEVDAVLGEAEVAIEIKSTEEVQNKHLKGLKTFAEEHPECRQIIVSLDRFNRKIGTIETIYVLDFLKKLWNGEIM